MLKYKLRKIPRKKFIIWSTMILMFIISLGSIVGFYAAGNPFPGASVNSIVGDTVIVNDLEADWNYYNGLNYTEVTNKTVLPGTNDSHTGVQSTNKYNINTLAAVQINYNGVDINNQYQIGYVSTVNTERQSKFTYYKYVPIVNNKVTVELIDNPYADRPSGKGFNGWVCDEGNATNTVSCSDVTFTYDDDYYLRYVSIPEPIADANGDKKIVINLKASWATADVITSTDNIGQFKEKSMQPIYKYPEYRDEEQYINTFKDNVTYYELTRYDNREYIYTGMPNCANTNHSIQWRNNAYQCRSNAGCNCYIATEDEFADFDDHYYIRNGGVNDYRNANANDFEYKWVIVPVFIGYNYDFSNGDSTVGYYYRVDNYNNTNRDLYYNQDGISCSVTNCGNTAYKLIQSNDPDEIKKWSTTVLENGFEQTTNTADNYYYFVTRDTNILDLNGSNQNYSSSLFNNNTVPYTITGSHDGAQTDVTNVRIEFGSLSLREDLVIENLVMNGPGWSISSSITTNNLITANNENLKIGRTVLAYYNGNTRELSANGVDGSGSDYDNYSNYRGKIMVEAGYYRHIRALSTTGHNDENIIFQLGNDYDRVTGNDDKLSLTYQAVSSTAGNHNSNTIIPASEIIVKSGRIGSYMLDNPNGTPGSYYMYGIYVGAHSGGNSNGLRTLKIEGGQVFSINGGPCIETNYNGNVIATYVTGGTVQNIVGGAGVSQTYGNRIISVTGGTVANAVAGGSNSYSGDASPGPMHGKTLVYIGGNATLGADLVYVNDRNNDRLYDVEEHGSVFGAGLGQNGSSTRGVVGNSHIIIDGSATINGSVYGGGNYGATGTNTDADTYTLVNILGGTINGSVYGAANRNGAGSSTYRYNRTTLNRGGQTPRDGVHLYINGEKINGRVTCNESFPGFNGNNCYYFTSNQNGNYVFDKETNIFVESNSAIRPRLPHSLIINMYGGNINGSLYGGSNITGNVYADVDINLYKGSVNSATSGVYGGGKGQNTTILSSTFIDTKTDTNSDLKINEIYGGSELGFVNNIGVTNINIDGGIIGNVYGGGKGNNNVSPNTDGNITVNMLNGDVNNIFGGNNIRGVIDTISTVNVSGGVIGNVYGGSDGTLLANSGGNINNVGAVNTLVNISGGTIETAVYGGGKSAPTTGSSTVNVTGGTFAQLDANGYLVTGTTPAEVFGGGEAARVTTTNVNILAGANVYNVYGGSNKSGVVTTTNVNNTAGNILCNSYGGGKIAEAVTTNNNLNGTNYSYVLRDGETAYTTLCGSAFGGGANANVTTANITLNNGSMINVYGGSNEGGTVTRTNVSIKRGTVDNVFGGNNQGGATVDSLVNVEPNNVADLSVNNVFGGSNGFNASISGTTTTNIKSGVVKQDVFGGGNQAKVVRATYVNMYGGEVNNLYGGGNRSFVGNVTVNDAGEISSKVNATLGTTHVNVINGVINENVYGSSNASFVIGNTNLRIGDTALDYLGINDNVNRTITIKGSVFAGSETNAEESTVYNDSYEGVTDDANGNGGTGLVEIDASSYIANNTSTIIINGSIYGSGNNSKVVHGSDIHINKYGTKQNPAISTSIQRAADVYITDSHIELNGTVDRADPNSYRYALIRLDSLNLYGSNRTSGTYMYLRQGASFLRSLTSGSYVNGRFTPQKVDEVNGNLQVSVSDNRIYMLTNKVLSISDSAAPVYDTTTTYAGPITGMTFLGMYTHESGKEFIRGIYDYSYGNGSTYVEANTGSISKSAYTYAYGLNLTNYTMDEQVVTHGFYTNVIDGEDEETDSPDESDDGKKLRLEYVGVTPANETTLYYKWVIGIEPIEIIVDLIADKYSESGAVNALISLDELKETIVNENGYEVKQEWRDAIMTIQSVDTTSFGATEADAIRAFDGVLVDKSEVPTVNTSDKNRDGVVDANNYFALSMGTTSAGWLNNYKTNFYDEEYNITDNNFCDTATGNCTGNQVYLYDSTTVQRNLSFWLYHSKNLDFSYIDKSFDESNMLISMNQVYIDVEFRNPHGDPTSTESTQLVRITVNISLSDGELDKYGGIIAPGKKYEVFQGRPATIASNGSFSIYQSLSLDLTKPIAGSASGELWNVDKLYHKDKTVLVTDSYGNTREVEWSESYRYLSSSYAFPVGTVITMLDLKNNEQYFYEVTTDNYNVKAAEIAQNNTCKYYLEDFVRMGSVSSNKKFDDDMNGEGSTKYYYKDANSRLAVEEFIFNVDFAGANVNVTNPAGEQHYFFLELARREAGAEKVIISTKGTPREEMIYKLVPQVSSVIATEGGYLQPDGTTSDSTTIYVGETTELELETSLIQLNEAGQQLLGVSDTVFDEYKLGAKITIKRARLDESGNIVYDNNGNVIYDDMTNDLFGTVMRINGQEYYPQTDGSTRIELAGRITDVISNIGIDFSNASLSYGDYVLVVETFVSYDGLYYGDFEPTYNEFPFVLLNNQYGLDVKTSDTYMVTHDVNTGEDSTGSRDIHYIVDVVNGLSNPNLKVSISRRDYSSTYGTNYQLVPITNLIESIRFGDSEDNVLLAQDACFNVSADGLCYEYNLSNITNSSIHKTYDVYMTVKNGPEESDLGTNKPNAKWKSGTYRINYSLYDGDVFVGTVYDYLVIRSLGVDEIVIEGSGD